MDFLTQILSNNDDILEKSIMHDNFTLLLSVILVNSTSVQNGLRLESTPPFPIFNEKEKNAAFISAHLLSLK